MTPTEYLGGSALLALVAAAAAFAAVRARRRLMPEAIGAAARLGEAVLGLTVVVTLLEVLGTLSLLRPVPLAIGAVLVIAASTRLRPARDTRGSDDRTGPDRHAQGSATAVPPGPPPISGFGRVLTIGALALVAAQWALPVAVALKQGMGNGDSLWYHMPFAARFAQDAATTGLHFLGSEPLTTFYPAHGSLPHALGITALGTDLLSPLVNLGWLALALLAGWCVGRDAGLEPATLLGTALVVTAPIMAGTQAGEGTSDIAGLALFVAAVALLVSARGRGPGVALAALAAGLALGTKVSLGPPVVLLAVGAVAATPRGGRTRAGVIWGLGLVAAGGYWYARNLLAVGNPAPWFGLSLGPLELPSPPTPLADRYRYTVAHYATDLGVWREWLLPSLRAGFGGLWPPILALAAGGALLAAARRGPRIQRSLGVVAVAAVALYTITPQSAGGPEGSPGLFLFNLRFITPPLAVGLVLLPLVLVRWRDAGRWTRAGDAVALAYALLLVVTVVSSDPLRGGPLRVPAAAAALVLAVAAAAALVARRRPRRLVTAAAAAAAGGLLLAAGWVIGSDYLEGRYAQRSSPLDAVYAWARGVRGARIGVAGLHQQYPLYGTDLSNRPQYVGRRGPHGAFTPPASCPAWRAALRAGGYRFVVTAPIDYPVNRLGRAPREAAWTRSDPAARELLGRGGQISVFRLDRPPDPARCP